jgi:hypothetical protein
VVSSAIDFEGSRSEEAFIIVSLFLLFLLLFHRFLCKVIIFLPLHDVFPLRILVVVEEEEEEHELVVPDIVIISVSLSLSNTFSSYDREQKKKEEL